MTPGERSCLGQVVYPGHQFRACLDATLDAMPGPSKFPKAPSKHVLRACLVGALENLPAPGRSIQPQASKIGRLETLPGPGSFPRVRSKQTPPGCLAAAAWVRL